MERTPLSVAPAHTSEAALTPRRNWLLVVALVLGVAAAGAEFYVCVARYNNDFLWHRIQGQTFLNRTLYEQSGLHYLPARAMIDSVTAWLPYRVDRALWLAAACAGLVWCTRFWSRLGRPTAATSWVPAAVVLALMGGYLHRDFAECGLQLALLIILTAAFAALLAGKQWLSGLSLGLAVVYKVTPILFLPYLIWKRQWRAAGWMVASIALWCALPAVHLGWQKNTELHGKWYQNTMHLLTLDDPSENGVELPKSTNQSLPLCLARLVQDYPADHPLMTEGRGIKLASLDKVTTRRVVKGTLLAIAAALAWRMRRKVDLADGRRALAGEWAMVCILIALLSPLCWLQHLVLAIPAALLFAERAAAGAAPRWQWGIAFVAMAPVLLVHRDLIGAAACEAISSLHPHGLASLLVGLLAISSPVPTRRTTNDMPEQEIAASEVGGTRRRPLARAEQSSRKTSQLN